MHKYSWWEFGRQSKYIRHVFRRLDAVHDDGSTELRRERKLSLETIELIVVIRRGVGRRRHSVQADFTNHRMRSRFYFASQLSHPSVFPILLQVRPPRMHAKRDGNVDGQIVIAAANRARRGPVSRTCRRYPRARKSRTESSHGGVITVQVPMTVRVVHFRSIELSRGG